MSTKVEDCSISVRHRKNGKIRLYTRRTVVEHLDVSEDDYPHDLLLADRQDWMLRQIAKTLTPESHNDTEVQRVYDEIKLNHFTRRLAEAHLHELDVLLGNGEWVNERTFIQARGTRPAVSYLREYERNNVS